MSTLPLLPLIRAVLIACLLVAVRPEGARAQSSLEAIGPGTVTELSHRLDIRFGPQLYEVEETLVFANRAKGTDAEAQYTFELPAQAAIEKISVETALGKKSSYALVGAEAATRLVANPTSDHDADMGLVRMIRSEGSGASDRNTYELRVFPIPAARTTTVKIAWSGTVRLVAGSYSVRLPSRGTDTKLARTEIVVGATVPMDHLYGGETLLAKRSRPGQKHRFFAPAVGDMVIQGRGEPRATGPRAEVALYPLSPTSGVAALRVLLPDAAKKPVPTIDRAVLIVDTSSSMSGSAAQAAATLADGLLAELGGNTRIEAVLYERTSRVVLGGFLEATREVRSKILGAIRSSQNGNGSNLAAALSHTFRILSADKESDLRKTLIIVITDGMLPTTVSGDEAADLLGEPTLAQANVLSVVLVPPNAPLPDVHRSTLGDMMRRGKGRIVALRYSDAKTRASSLLGELGQAAPLETLEVELSSGEWVGANLSGQLRPGSSITALGFYQGKPPARVTVTGMRAGVPETLVATRVKAAQAKRLAAITIANARPFGMPGKDTTAKQSQRDLRAAAATFGVVTAISAGIAVPVGDGYAMDRIRSAKRWGMQTYRRLPPPAERTDAGKHFEPFRLQSKARADDQARTGFIDKDMIARRVKAHVIPQARRCYEKLLRRDQTANGALKLHIEMARGEVLHASIPILPPSLEPIRACIEDAMYAMPVPKVHQGQAEELVSIANYPLRFRMAKAKGRKGAVEPATNIDDPSSTDNPLLGLPD